jgi:tyrosyl-tRNA synthetase
MAAAAASGSPAMSVEEKLALITRNLEEVVGQEEVASIVRERPLKIYWGTATTGAPHIGYFVPMSKIADFLRAGCDVTILFADLHAFLDNMKAPWELLAHRVRYYENVIKSMLRDSLGVPIEKLRFVQGTQFQLSREYTLDVYKMTSIVTLRNAQKAGAEVVKQVESPLMSGLLYPLLQALDEEHLHVDAQFGGTDQRKIFMLAREHLPLLGYKKRIHLMNPMVPGLQGSKMSSSEKGSKIDLLDSEAEINRKVKGAFCEERSLENNGVMAFVRMVLFPLAVANRQTFVVERAPKHGGNLVFETYEQLEKAFLEGALHPLDLKTSVAQRLNQLLAPIRKHFERPELQELIRLAYPERVAAEEEKKQAAAAAAAAAAAGVEDEASHLDFRVARVLDAEVHPQNDALYTAQLDVGGGQTRAVVIGLAKVVPLERLKGARVVAFVNTESTNFRGKPSEAMVLAAYKADEAGNTTHAELLVAPAEADVGQRVLLEGIRPAEPARIFKPKKKEFDKFLPHLAVTDQGVAAYKGAHAFVVPGKGLVTVPTLRSVPLK